MTPAGPPRSARLTEEIGCSRRYLIGLFNDHVGLPPKLIARILRFEHALEFADGGEIGWAEIAQRCGYYDQAHMIRDFRAFTGQSPKRLPSREAPRWRAGRSVTDELD